MVAGIEKFREALGAYNESYIIIGGTACDLMLIHYADNKLYVF